MKRTSRIHNFVVFVLAGPVILMGCSTHPIADTLDCFAPGKVGKNRVQPYGGVCLPHQGQANPFQTVIPVTPGGTTPTTPPATVPVVPPAAPLPGSGTTPIPPIPPPASFPR